MISWMDQTSWASGEPISARLLPTKFRIALRRAGVAPSRWLLMVSTQAQQMILMERDERVSGAVACPDYVLRRKYLISTSGYGNGQEAASNKTPLGLHRVAVKVGGGYPIGTVFKSRKPIGCTWQGMPEGAIVHRILWLEGLEPGFNRGGKVDTFQRYIYIHGFGDETTLGIPNSHGCIHLSATDLIPLYDRVPVGTLVWIGEG